MPFDTDAGLLLPRLPHGTANHAILDYLINHALGRANAKSWDAIVRNLGDLGVGS